MKYLLIKLIAFYQKIPLPTHKLCRFTPTCSEYSKIAIERFGAFKGSILSIKRIIRCNPFNKKFGYDPVPEGAKK